ncbi:MAG TPA: hut operon positive regulator HutP, partial [Thermoanaerobacterales bacterium]|nr:hut operon positive regulator HutP [Thermoanaerobacterales bacterium]
MDSTDVSKIALKMALSTRSEEAELKQTYRNMK